MQITNTNNQFRVANGSDIEFYSFAQIKAVSWRKDSVTSNYILLIYFTANDLDNPAEFDLTKITNQAGWTNNAAGIQQAVADVSGWMSTSSGSATLTSILASLQAGREFESRLVKDASSVIWNEIRYMDTDTGAFTVEYRDAAGATGTPTGSVTFVESTATLASILAKNTEIETTANAIETSNAAILLDTAAIDTATAAINTNTATLGVATNTAVMTRGTGSVTVTQLVKSISVYNAHASATGTINIGGAGAVNLLAGETVNFDAGGNGNKFPASHFVVDGGGTADMLIIYTY